MLTLAAWASISLIVIAAVNVLILGGLVYLVFMVRNQFRQLQEQVQPLVGEVRTTLHTVQQTAADIGTRAEHMAARAENLTSDVAMRAEHLAATITQRADEITRDFTRRVEEIASDVSQRTEQVTAQFTDRFDHLVNGWTERFDRISDDLSAKLQNLIDVGDRLVERIAARLDTTTAVVEEAVTKPLVTLAGVRAGISKGLDVWRDLSKRAQGDGSKERAREAEARRLIEEAPPVVGRAGTAGE